MGTAIKIIWDTVGLMILLAGVSHYRWVSRFGTVDDRKLSMGLVILGAVLVMT